MRQENFVLKKKEQVTKTRIPKHFLSIPKLIILSKGSVPDIYCILI